MLRSLIVVLGALVLAPTASAKPISMPVSESALTLAYAPGRVLVAEAAPSGDDAIVVRELHPADRSERVLAEIAIVIEPGVSPDVTLVANASGYLIALGGTRDLLVLGGYDGSLRTLADCAPAADEAPVLLAAGTGGFAFASGHCGLPATATVAPDGTVTPVAPATPPPGAAAAPYGSGDGSEPAVGLAYTEPYLAVATPGFARVVDLTSGVERRVPQGLVGLELAMTVLPDGTLAFVTEPFSGVRVGLYAWPPGAPAPTFIDAHASRTVVGVAGGGLLYEAGAAARIAIPGGGSHELRLPRAGFPALLGSDSDQAAFRTFSCTGEQRVTVVDVTAPPEPGSVSGCPVSFVHSTIRFGKSGTARLTVRCSNGCRDGLTIIQRATRRHPCVGKRRQDKGVCPDLATAELDLPPSTHARRITLHLTDAGRRLRGRTLDAATVFVSNVALTRENDIRKARL